MQRGKPLLRTPVAYRPLTFVPTTLQLNTWPAALQPSVDRALHKPARYVTKRGEDEEVLEACTWTPIFMKNGQLHFQFLGGHDANDDRSPLGNWTAELLMELGQHHRKEEGNVILPFEAFAVIRLYGNPTTLYGDCIPGGECPARHINGGGNHFPPRDSVELTRTRIIQTERVVNRSVETPRRRSASPALVGLPSYRSRSPLVDSLRLPEIIEECQWMIITPEQKVGQVLPALRNISKGTAWEDFAKRLTVDTIIWLHVNAIKVGGEKVLECAIKHWLILDPTRPYNERSQQLASRPSVPSGGFFSTASGPHDPTRHHRVHQYPAPRPQAVEADLGARPRHSHRSLRHLSPQQEGTTILQRLDDEYEED